MRKVVAVLVMIMDIVIGGQVDEVITTMMDADFNGCSDFDDTDVEDDDDDCGGGADDGDALHDELTAMPPPLLLPLLLLLLLTLVLQPLTMPTLPTVKTTPGIMIIAVTRIQMWAKVLLLIMMKRAPSLEP